MKIANIPSKFAIPFASSAGPGYIRTIPQTPTGTAGQASLQQGFPPENFSPVNAGGVPPFGQDFNGLLNQVTQWNQWQATGAFPPYDSAFQTAIGGYPQYSCVSSLVTVGVVWLSIVDDNLTNPDAGGAGWVVFSRPSIAAPTLWVRTDGNDNNSGSANDPSHAMATIQGAMNKAANVFNLLGKTLTINLGNAGTYAGFSVPGITVTVNGDNTNVANCVITGAAGGNAPVGCNSGGVLTMNWLSVINPSATQISVQASYGGSIMLGNIVLGGVAATTGFDLKAFPGGSITLGGGNLRFARNCYAAVVATGGNVSFQVGTTITMSGNIWGGYGMLAEDCGSIIFGANTITGTATGTRYRSQSNGVIDTAGAGASYWPGSGAGSTTTGGQYV